MSSILKIQFPEYFKNNSQFASLELNNERLVDYTHEFTHIKNVQLKIRQMFVVFVVEGEIKFEEPSCTTFVTANQAVLVRTGNYLMSEELSNEAQRFQAILFFLSDQMISDFCLQQSLQTSQLPSQCEKHIYPIKIKPSLVNFFQSIISLAQDPGPLRTNEALLQLKATELLFYLLEQSGPDELNTVLLGMLNSDAVRMEEVLENHYLQNKKLEELAFLCGVSLSQFKRKFRELYQTTPGKWLRDRKLKHAHSLLLTGDLSISEIAYSAGFESPSNFIKLYKLKYGKTPLQYRQSAQ